MEGDHPPVLLTDVLGEDDDRRELSPQARRWLMAVVAILCVVATVVKATILVRDDRVKDRREALAARRADAIVLATQTVGIGSRASTESAALTWRTDVQIYTRDGSRFDLLSLSLGSPWTVEAIIPDSRSAIRTATFALTATCTTIAQLRVPTSVLVQARRPGRRAVLTRVAVDGAAFLERPRADCDLVPAQQ